MPFCFAISLWQPGRNSSNSCSCCHSMSACSLHGADAAVHAPECLACALATLANPRALNTHRAYVVRWALGLAAWCWGRVRMCGGMRQQQGR